MKKINSQKLLMLLQEDVRRIVLHALALKNEPGEKLLRQPAPDKWSIAQVLEHLNIYSRHYIAAFEKKLRHHETKASQFFLSGFAGQLLYRINATRGE
jgi:uncharacterized damage-inducible protein DinB